MAESLLDSLSPTESSKAKITFTPVRPNVNFPKEILPGVFELRYDGFGFNMEPLTKAEMTTGVAVKISNGFVGHIISSEEMWRISGLVCEAHLVTGGSNDPKEKDELLVLAFNTNVGAEGSMPIYKDQVIGYLKISPLVGTDVERREYRR